MTITEREKRSINFSIYAVRQNEHTKTIHSIENCVEKLQSYDKKISRLACKNRLENKLQMWEDVRATFGTIGFYLSKIEEKTTDCGARAIVTTLKDSVLLMYHVSKGKKFTFWNYNLLRNGAKMTLENLRHSDAESMREYFRNIKSFISDNACDSEFATNAGPVLKNLFPKKK